MHDIHGLNVENDVEFKVETYFQCEVHDKHQNPPQKYRIPSRNL